MVVPRAMWVDQWLQVNVVCISSKNTTLQVGIYCGRHVVWDCMTVHPLNLSSNWTKVHFNLMKMRRTYLPEMWKL